MYEKKYYVDEEFAKTVLNEQWNYLTFQISECTEEALSKKCDFILQCQKINWQPLLLEYKTNVKMYIKTFYIKK